MTTHDDFAGHTPGPWRDEPLDGMVGSNGNRVLFGAFGGGLVSAYNNPEAAANTKLARAAPTLLAEVTALRAKVARLREALEEAVRVLRAAGLGDTYAAEKSRASLKEPTP